MNEIRKTHETNSCSKWKTAHNLPTMSEHEKEMKEKLQKCNKKKKTKINKKSSIIQTICSK